MLHLEIIYSSGPYGEIFWNGTSAFGSLIPELFIEPSPIFRSQKLYHRCSKNESPAQRSFNLLPSSPVERYCGAKGKEKQKILNKTLEGWIPLPTCCARARCKAAPTKGRVNRLHECNMPRVDTIVPPLHRPPFPFPRPGWSSLRHPH